MESNFVYDMTLAFSNSKPNTEKRKINNNNQKNTL